MKSSLSTLALLVLAACGGGGNEEESSVTFVHVLPDHDGLPTMALAQSFDTMNRQIGERGVAPVQVQCGTWTIDTRKPRGAQTEPVAIPGFPLELVYYTFLASDVERVRDLPWFRVVDNDWRETYVDPDNCRDFRPRDWSSEAN